MDRGFVKLWRRSIDSAAFSDPILWKLWCLCLMKANYKKKYVSIEGIASPIEVLPGQFITGRFALHREFYPKPKKKQKSPLTLWRKLEILQNMQNLNIRSHAKYSIITISNWEQYQQNEQQVNNRRTTGEQQVNTNKKEKKEKKETTQGLDLSNLLLNLILDRRNSFKKPNISDWAKQIDLMIRVDKHNPGEIKNVITWCQQDDFWQNNILSTVKLRKQFDQLSMKMSKDNAKNKTPYHDPKYNTAGKFD